MPGGNCTELGQSKAGESMRIDLFCKYFSVFMGVAMAIKVQGYYLHTAIDYLLKTK